MHRPRADVHVVDVAAVDADQRGAVLDQPVGRVRGQERMLAEIGVGAPVPVPAGVDQHRLAARRRGLRMRRRRWRGRSPTAAERRCPAGRRARAAPARRDRRRRRSDGTASRDRCRCWRPCRSGRSGRSSRRRNSRPMPSRVPEIADVRARQALVGRHAMLDHMAEVDDPLLFKIRHDAIAPISSHRTLSAADGNAPMPPAVDHEPGRADHVHRLIDQRLAGELARRQQQIGEQDQHRAGPADDLDRELDARALTPPPASEARSAGSRPSGNIRARCRYRCGSGR